MRVPVDEAGEADASVSDRARTRRLQVRLPQVRGGCRSAAAHPLEAGAMKWMDKDNDSFMPLRVNYRRVLPNVLRANIRGIALSAMKWLSLAALAISLVLGVLIVSNKNRCDRLMRFIRGDTTLEWEAPNDPAQ